MKKKIPVQFLKSPSILHTFTRDQIERADLTNFIKKFGEGQLVGGRRYHLQVTGRFGWLARYLKEVDADETTVRF